MLAYYQGVIRRVEEGTSVVRLLALARLRLLIVLALVAAFALPAQPAPALAQADPCPEPNNGFTNACFVGPAAPTVQGFISAAADIDAYKFEVSGRLAQVRIELSGLPADYDLHVFNGNAGFIGESTNQGLTPDVLDVPLIPGPYFVFVNSSQGGFSPNRPYTLSITVTPIPDPRPGLKGDPCPEPNEAFDRACPLTPGQLVFGMLAIQQDVDTYAFDVAEADSRVTAALGESPADFVFELLREDGSEEGRSDPFSILIGRLKPGRYFVRISRSGGEPNPAPYELLVTVTPPSRLPVASSNDPCPEPNDDNEAACNLGTGSPAIGFISTPFDIDRYRFEVSGGPMRVHLELTDLPADYELDVQALDGGSKAASHNGGTFPEAADAVLEPGTYIVVVYSLVGGASDERPYRLALSMAGPDDGPPAAATVLFAENFLNAGWHFSNESSNLDAYEVGTYDGEYVLKLHHAASQGSVEYDEPGGADLVDFQLDLDARVTGLPEKNGGFYVAFRRQDTINTYAVYVDVVREGSPGGAKLVRWVDGRTTVLADWVEAPAIRKGSQPNHVTIRAVGDSLTVAINGQQLLSGRDGRFRRGDIGLGVITWDRPTEVRFDNVLATAAR